MEQTELNNQIDIHSISIGEADLKAENPEYEWDPKEYFDSVNHLESHPIPEIIHNEEVEESQHESIVNNNSSPQPDPKKKTKLRKSSIVLAGINKEESLKQLEKEAAEAPQVSPTPKTKKGSFSGFFKIFSFKSSMKKTDSSSAVNKPTNTRYSETSGETLDTELEGSRQGSVVSELTQPIDSPQLPLQDEELVVESPKPIDIDETHEPEASSPLSPTSNSNKAKPSAGRGLRRKSLSRVLSTKNREINIVKVDHNEELDINTAEIPCIETPTEPQESNIDAIETTSTPIAPPSSPPQSPKAFEVVASEEIFREKSSPSSKDQESEKDFSEEVEKRLSLSTRRTPPPPSPQPPSQSPQSPQTSSLLSSMFGDIEPQKIINEEPLDLTITEESQQEIIETEAPISLEIDLEPIPEPPTIMVISSPDNRRLSIRAMTPGAPIPPPPPSFSPSRNTSILIQETQTESLNENTEDLQPPLPIVEEPIPEITPPPVVHTVKGRRVSVHAVTPGAPLPPPPPSL